MHSSYNRETNIVITTRDSGKALVSKLGSESQDFSKPISDTLVPLDRPICKVITSSEADESILQFTIIVAPAERLDFMSSRQYFRSNSEI